MEKRTTNLTIEDFEDKKYGAGKRYTRFKTSEGWISSFDKEIIEKLKDSEGKSVSVEITTDNDDREKITKFLGEASEDESEDATITGKEAERVNNSFKPNARKSVQGSVYEKDPVGLAVECFVALLDNIVRVENTPEIMADTMATIVMTEAINRVKQAQKAFG